MASSAPTEDDTTSNNGTMISSSPTTDSRRNHPNDSSNTISVTKNAIPSILLSDYREPTRTTRNGTFYPIVQIVEIKSKVTITEQDFRVVDTDDTNGISSMVIMESKSRDVPVLVLSDTTSSIEAIVEGISVRTNHPREAKNKNDSITTTATTSSTTQLCLDDLHPNMLIRIKEYKLKLLPQYNNKRFGIILSSFEIVESPSPPPPLDIVIPNDWNRMNRRMFNILYKLHNKELYELENLSLGYSKNDIETCMVVANGIRANKFIPELNLARNRLGKQGLQVILDALADVGVIRGLDLSGNDIENLKDVRRIVRSLQQNNKKGIRELILSGNGFGAMGVQLLAHRIFQKPTCTIQTLCLDGCSLHDGIPAIAEMIKVNKSLKVLSLGGNQIMDDEFIVLVTALKFNRTLQELRVQHNDIDNDGIEFLADELKYNTTLTALWLFSNSNTFNHDGACALYKAMEYNTTLRTLMLDRNTQRYYYWEGGRLDNHEMQADEDEEEIEHYTRPYEDEMTSEIRTMLVEYNDTLTNFSDPKLPIPVQHLASDRYDAQTVQVPQRLAPKKGSRQRMDMYNWLQYYANKWWDDSCLTSDEQPSPPQDSPIASTTEITTTQSSLLPRRQRKERHVRKRSDPDKSIVSTEKKKVCK